MKNYRFTVLLLCLALSASAVPAVDYPPELILREQSLVCKTPDAVSSTASFWASSGREIRGYQLFNFSVDPADIAMGSSWLAYDCGQQRPVAIIRDMNEVCGVQASGGVSGQRITATMQTGLLLGTGAAAGAKVFPGGAVYRLANIEGSGPNPGRLVGRLPEGWGVVSFDQQYLGKAIINKGEEWPKHSQGVAVMLASSMDGKDYELYRVLYDKLQPLGIRGGAELKSFFVSDGKIFYRNGQEDVLCKILDSDEAATVLKVEQGSILDLRLRPGYVELFRGTTNDAGSNTPEPEQQYGFSPSTGDLTAIGWKPERNKPSLLSNTKGALEGVAPLAADQHPRQAAWVSGSRPQPKLGIDDFEWQKMDRVGIREGFIVFARKPESGKAFHLYLYCPQIKKLHDLGAPAAFEKKGIDTIYQVRVTAGGEIGVLAGNDQLRVFQLYYYPLQKQVTADRLLSTGHNLARNLDGRKPVSFRMVQNLYDLERHADRGFFSMLYASDGKVYFCSMPHNPDKGASIFRYDPKQPVKVERLGAFDDLACTKKDRVHNMMHAKPAEIAGRLYFTGQDPFYGQRNFPGWTDEKPSYDGSPIVMLDLKSGDFKNIGIPFPDRKEGIFVTIADSKRNVLVVRLGYYTQEWYELGLNDDGTLSGKSRRLPLSGQQVALAANGLLYEIRSGKAEEKAAAPGEIWSYDPVSDEQKKVAEFTAEGLNGAAFPLARKDKAVGNGARWIEDQPVDKNLHLFFEDTAMVAILDFQTGKLGKLVLFGDENAKYPAPIGDAFLAGNRIYYIYRFSGKVPALSTFDLADGTLRRYGHMEDAQGRMVNELTQLASSPDGTVYFGGFVYGVPDDQRHWTRSEYGSPHKVLSGFFEISELPK